MFKKKKSDQMPEIRSSDINGCPIYEVDLPMDATIRINFTEPNLVKPFTVSVRTRDEYLVFKEKSSK